MQSVYDKPEQFSANVGSLESAGSQAAEPNDGRGAKSELLLLLFLLFREDGTAKYVLKYAPQCECFSATIRSRAECPPSPVVFFPQLALFSHPYRIHPETKHSSPSCLLPPARSFFLIHIEFIQKKIINLLPVVFFPSSLVFSHPHRNSSRKKFINLLPVVFFPSSLFFSHPYRIHPEKKFINLLPVVFFPSLLFLIPKFIQEKHSSPYCLLPQFTLSQTIEFIEKKKTFISLIVFFQSSLFSHPKRIHPEKKHSSP